MNTLAELTQKMLAEFDESDSNCRISALVKENFEAWENILIPELEKRKMHVYKALQGMFSEAGITVSTGVISQAMYRERQKRSGAAKNGSSKASSKRAAHAAISPRIAGQAEPGPSVTPATQNIPKPATAGVTPENYTGPVVPGSKPDLISGKGGDITWEMKLIGPNDYEVVLDGQVMPYKNIGISKVLIPITQKLYQKKDVEGMIEVLHFMQDYFHTFAGRASLGRGLTLKPLAWPTGEAALVQVLQNDIKDLS